MLATYVIETVGTQEYDIAEDAFLDRIRETYGDEAADDLAAHVRFPHV
jgi:adenosine kinase